MKLTLKILVPLSVLLIALGCSKSDQKKISNDANAAVQDTKRAASDAADATKHAASDAAQQAKDSTAAAADKN